MLLLRLELTVVKFLKKYGFGIGFLVCVVVYLSLAYKNPFKTNNLISNLEPSPDVYYYSVPAWNWVHGKGFKMEAFGIEIKKVVPPFYGIVLAPFFKIWGDVRCYYYANVLLGILSIYLFLKLVEVFLEKRKLFLEFVLGLVLVTNFYFYNLPTLLMAENILIPLTLMAVILMFKPLKLPTFIGSLIVMGLLAFTKISSFPVLLIFGLVLLVKVIKSKFWKRLSKKQLILLGILLVFIFITAFVKVALPNIKNIPAASGSFSIKFISKTLPVYLKEFVGINGSYLWFANQQIEQWLGIFCLVGMVVGLILKKYRQRVLILLALILAVTVFHSMMSYPEGRYISTVIPLFMLGAGVILDKLNKNIYLILFLGVYFLIRGTVNGFYERKATSLKRQILNNRLEENEIPWSYIAVQNFNGYFKDKTDVYLGTVTNPFYINYFGSGNYKFIPLSPRQEFSGVGKGFIDEYFKNTDSLVGVYRGLLNAGKEVYITNYYLTYYHGGLDGDYKSLENNFKFSQVFDGCLGECKIYKLDLKK